MPFCLDSRTAVIAPLSERIDAQGGGSSPLPPSDQPVLRVNARSAWRNCRQEQAVGRSLCSHAQETGIERSGGSFCQHLLRA